MVLYSSGSVLRHVQYKTVVDIEFLAIHMHVALLTTSEALGRDENIL